MKIWKKLNRYDIAHYILVALVPIASISTPIFLSGYDFEKTVDLSLKIIQILAIPIGALWVYRKFGWEKKCENIIRLKASLMEFSREHNLSAMQYRGDEDIVGYKNRLLPIYSKMISTMHLAYYVPKKIREKIFDALWLTIGNNHGENLENLNENWEKFEVELKEIYDEFDHITTVALI